jgi:hypothetical protein
LRNGAARMVLTRGGRMAVTHGRSPAWGRGSGGGKPTRRTLGRWGLMHGARAWTDEMNGARDEKEILAGGRRLRFNGKRRGGGPKGWTPHGGRAGEREGEGGGPWRGVEQRASGAAAARPRRVRAACCCVTVENSGVGATRIDVADRWAGTLRGPGRQQLGAARGSTLRRLARC